MRSFGHRYVFAYNLGMAGIGWAILVEVLPSRYRCTAAGFAVAGRWVRSVYITNAYVTTHSLCNLNLDVDVLCTRVQLAAFTVAMLNTFLEIWPKWLLFEVEAAFLVVTSAFAWWALGETRGRSLEHIDNHLRTPRLCCQ